MESPHLEQGELVMNDTKGGIVMSEKCEHRHDDCNRRHGCGGGFALLIVLFILLIIIGASCFGGGGGCGYGGYGGYAGGYGGYCC